METRRKLVYAFDDQLRQAIFGHANITGFEQQFRDLEALIPKRYQAFRIGVGIFGRIWPTLDLENIFVVWELAINGNGRIHDMISPRSLHISSKVGGDETAQLLQLIGDPWVVL